MQIAREPIFRSTLRSFFATLAIIIGIGFGCIVVAIAATAFTNTISFPSLSQATLAPNAQDLILAKPSNTPVILRINLHGVVGLDGLSSSKINDLTWLVLIVSVRSKLHNKSGILDSRRARR